MAKISLVAISPIRSDHAHSPQEAEENGNKEDQSGNPHEHEDVNHRLTEILVMRANLRPALSAVVTVVVVHVEFLLTPARFANIGPDTERPFQCAHG